MDNFKDDNIHDVLLKAGYNINKRTLFIWEGVIYYLTKGEVEKTLNSIQNNSPEGSIICFDYTTTWVETPNPSEPFQFWISKEKIELMLSNFGIKIDNHIDSTEMKRRYLTLHDGTIAEDVSPVFCLVKASVVKSL